MKYQKHLESVKNVTEQEKVYNEMKVFMEETNDAKVNCGKLIKISETLENDFVSCVKEAEFEKQVTQVSSVISKTNTLKQGSKELRCQ